MATNAAPEPVNSGGDRPVLSGQRVSPPPAQLRKLSEVLALLVREFEVETVTLREAIALLEGRGYVLLVMILALPFTTPIPLPGVSTPFGLVIALIGLRLALGQKPWLPARLLNTTLPPTLFAKLFAATQKIMRWLEYLLRPRLVWMTESAALRQLHAVPIFFAALLLLLPLPVPFSNALPGWAILLLAAGLLERDGLFILAGYLMFAASVVFFGVLGGTIAEAVARLWQWAGF